MTNTYIHVAADFVDSNTMNVTVMIFVTSSRHVQHGGIIQMGLTQAPNSVEEVIKIKKKKTQ